MTVAQDSVYNWTNLSKNSMTSLSNHTCFTSGRLNIPYKLTISSADILHSCDTNHALAHSKKQKPGQEETDTFANEDFIYYLEETPLPDSNNGTYGLVAQDRQFYQVMYYTPTHVCIKPNSCITYYGIHLI